MSKAGTDPIIRQIVGRCHVADSNLRVIRYVVSRLRDGKRTFLAMSREKKRALLGQTIACHAENRELYGWVMSGRHGYVGGRRVTR